MTGKRGLTVLGSVGAEINISNSGGIDPINSAGLDLSDCRGLDLFMVED